MPGALVLCAVGAIALFGIPGLLKPMELQTNAIEYIPHDSPLYKDTKKLEENIAGLSITEVWLKRQAGHGRRTRAVLRGLQHFSDALEADPQIGTGHRPDGDAALVAIRQRPGRQAARRRRASSKQLGGTLETLLPKSRCCSASSTRTLGADAPVGDHQDRRLQGLRSARQDRSAQKWKEAVASAIPRSREFKMEIVGLAPLQAKISQLLVPTLTQSFGLTVVIIFVAFLLVFRSAPARLMAMIPSLFAILVMFLIMRLLHMNLNVATILIASTVLGTSENDQIHFFYHFQRSAQRRLHDRGGAAPHARHRRPRHLLRDASSTPAASSPSRSRRCRRCVSSACLSAIAFVLSMIADFTALPAALWMVFRECPDEVKEAVKAGRPKPR